MPAGPPAAHRAWLERLSAPRLPWSCTVTEAGTAARAMAALATPGVTSDRRLDAGHTATDRGKPIPRAAADEIARPVTDLAALCR